jgi:MoxR-like ATPase
VTTASKTLPSKSSSKTRKTLPKSKTATKAVQTDTAVNDSPLHVAHVPEQWEYDLYVSRVIDYFGTKMQDMKVFEYAYEQGENLLLDGPTGAAKTSATRAFGAWKGLAVARIPSNIGIEPSQLFGRTIANDDATDSRIYVWVDGSVTYVFRNGGIVLWNEVNLTPSRIASVMFGALDGQREIILLDHKGEVIRAHRGTMGEKECWCDLSDDECNKRRVLIVADMNSGVEYTGTQDLNAALRNRFAIQIPWGYDAKVENALVTSKSLLEMARKIRDKAEVNNVITPVATNMLMEFERFARNISVGFAMGNFINHFQPDERDHIKLVSETYMDLIAKDYAPKTAKATVPDPADDDDQTDTDDVFGEDGLADWVFADDV